MALDMLSIPAISNDAKRVFSSCKLTITDYRNRLSIEVIEQLECLKLWMELEN
jgi:hAT family C-terminal dimerisation region